MLKRSLITRVIHTRNWWWWNLSIQKHDEASFLAKWVWIKRATVLCLFMENWDKKKDYWDNSSHVQHFTQFLSVVKRREQNKKIINIWKRFITSYSDFSVFILSYWQGGIGSQCFIILTNIALVPAYQWLETVNDSKERKTRKTSRGDSSKMIKAWRLKENLRARRWSLHKRPTIKRKTLVDNDKESKCLGDISSTA